MKIRLISTHLEKAFPEEIDGQVTADQKQKRDLGDSPEVVSLDTRFPHRIRRRVLLDSEKRQATDNDGQENHQLPPQGQHMAP